MSHGTKLSFIGEETDDVVSSSTENKNTATSSSSPQPYQQYLSTSIMGASFVFSDIDGLKSPDATNKGDASDENDENNNNNNHKKTSPSPPSAPSAATNWNSIDTKVSHAVQTENMDSMRKLKVLFFEVIACVHVEMYESERLGREKLAEWEKLLRMNIWRWDATLDVIRDAENRARNSLVEAESLWREEFFKDAFELEMMDL